MTLDAGLLSVMAYTPPGRSRRRASAAMATMAYGRHSCTTKLEATRSNEAAGKRVASALACTYVTRGRGAWSSFAAPLSLCLSLSSATAKK